MPSHRVPRAHRAHRGITLVEAAVVVAVAAIVASSAMPSFGAFLETRRLDAAATRLAADLRDARAAALQRGSGVRVTLHHAAWGSCYVVHTGAASQCRCDEHGAAACDGGALALKTVQLPASERIALQSNVASMRFDPLHGTATPAGTLRVVAFGGRAVHHVVNVLGRVRSCTPQLGVLAVPGWRGC
jgi:type IV fimbrial biogenesis protein FimT